MAVGKSIKRLDAVAKVTGRARYTEDLAPVGTKHAVYVRSTIAHGIVTSVNTDKAKNLAGVRAIFTYQDVPKIDFATAGHPYSMDKTHNDVADRRLLTSHVRFEGDEIAVVVADSEFIARKAARLVEVTYDKYPMQVLPEDILGEKSNHIHKNGNILGTHNYLVGPDIDTAVINSDITLESSYKTAMVQHCHLENHITYAYMEDNENIIIVSSTQIPHIVRRIVSEAIDFPLGNIKVIKPFVGGGFGAKQDVILEPMAAFLTQKLNGIPVIINLNREECMSCTRARHPVYGKVKAGVTDKGEITFLDIDATSLTGAYASHGHSVIAAGGVKACAMYPGKAIKYNAKTIYSNMPTAGAMRAYGTPQVIFFIESMVEDLARESNIDSIEFRLMNVGKEKDINPLDNKPMLTHGLIECLNKGKALIQWDKKKKEYLEKKSGNIRYGLGVAGFSYASGTYPVCVEIAGARMILNQDGTVHVHVGATEIGQGSDTVFAQMAAETTNISIEKIKVISTQDTDSSPFDTGAYASRQTYVNGQAVYKAAKKIKNKILQYAEDITKIPKDSLEINGHSVVYKKDTSTVVITLKDLSIDAYYHKDRGTQITSEASYKTKTNAVVLGCTFVDIEVDIALCQIKIKEIYNIHDSGKIINPMLAQGQVHGGMGMGIGAALMEELMIDEKTGRIYNNNLLDYKMPTIMDLPDLKCDFVETDEPSSSYGSKGLGEPPIISPAPAIRNAILDATGVKINELPITPKLLFKKFKEANL